MESDLLVTTSATCEHGTLPLYRKQLADAGIEFHVETPTEYPNMNGGGTLKRKMETMREMAQRFSHYEKLVFTCGFDVTFYGTKEDVLRKIPDDGVLLGAEKNCYPEPAMAELIVCLGPWKYYNGGLSCGTPASFIKWMDAVEAHPRYAEHASGLDQTFFNRLLAQQSPLVKLDNMTELFFNLYLGYDELDFENGLPVNTLCKTHPNFIHANGKWETGTLNTRYEASLKHDPMQRLGWKTEIA